MSQTKPLRIRTSIKPGGAHVFTVLGIIHSLNCAKEQDEIKRLGLNILKKPIVSWKLFGKNLRNWIFSNVFDWGRDMIEYYLYHAKHVYNFFLQRIKIT